MSDSEDAVSDRGAMSDPEDEADDLVGGASAAEEEKDSDDEPEPDPVEAPDAALGEGSTTLYVVYNRQYHKVVKTDGTKAGYKRCYNRIVKVKDGKVLGEMVADAKGWPKGENLTKLVSADKIVVFYGKLKAQKEGEPEVPLHPVWYLLVEVEGVSNKQDHQIARHIPKAVYLELIEAIKKDKAMERSSLLEMQAYGDNAKALHPAHNGFVKVVKGDEPKSAIVVPKPQEKPKKDGEGSSKEALPKKSAATAAKKADDKPADDKPAEKKTPKPSVDSFWKPKQAAAKDDDAGKKGPAKEGKEDEEEDMFADTPAEKDSKAVAEKKAPEAPTAAGKRAADGAAKSGASHKKRRVESVESYEFQICDPLATVDFPVPEGATAGKVTFTWSFA